MNKIFLNDLEKVLIDDKNFDIKLKKYEYYNKFNNSFFIKLLIAINKSESLNKDIIINSPEFNSSASTDGLLLISNGELFLIGSEKLTWDIYENCKFEDYKDLKDLILKNFEVRYKAIDFLREVALLNIIKSNTIIGNTSSTADLKLALETLDLIENNIDYLI